MKYKEYQNIRQQLQKKIDALDTAWSLVQEYGVSEKPIKKGEIARTVKTVVDTITTDFDVTTIEGLVKQTNPYSGIKKVNISTILKRLEKEQIVTIIEKGSGRRPTIYRKIQNSGMKMLA